MKRFHEMVHEEVYEQPLIFQKSKYSPENRGGLLLLPPSLKIEFTLAEAIFWIRGASYQ
jgi:hypothetical protein